MYDVDLTSEGKDWVSRIGKGKGEARIKTGEKGEDGVVKKSKDVEQEVLEKSSLVCGF